VRHRGPEREHLHALRFQVHLHGVDLVVAGLHGGGGGDVLLEQRADREVESLLGGRTHGEEPAAEVDDLGLEVDGHRSS